MCHGARAGSRGNGMSIETKSSGQDYPPGGARDLLRLKVSDVNINTLSQEGRNTIFAATDQLVVQTAELFRAYGYYAARTEDQRYGGYWTFALQGWERALSIRPRHSHGKVLDSWLEVTPRQPESGIKPDLVWDIAEASWYGPVIMSQPEGGYMLRDHSTPGCPSLRVSPIEELVGAILKVLS